MKLPNWVDSIPKIIDTNECWIPQIGYVGNHGYVIIELDGRQVLLHRVVCEIIYGKLDINIEVRHGYKCDKRCFNPSHIKPGTRSDNAKDMLRDGTHNNARKDVCPKCGKKYTVSYLKSGVNKGTYQRYCRTCNNTSRNLKRRLAREKT